MRGLLDPVYANVGWTMEEAEPIDITWVTCVYWIVYLIIKFIKFTSIASSFKNIDHSFSKLLNNNFYLLELVGRGGLLIFF